MQDKAMLRNYFFIYMRRPQKCFLTLPRPQNSPIKPQKAQKKSLKLVNTKKARNFLLLRKLKLIAYMIRPQNSFLNPPQPQNSPTPDTAPKSPKWPLNWSKLKRQDKLMLRKFFSDIWRDSKTVFWPYFTPKIAQ